MSAAKKKETADVVNAQIGIDSGTVYKKQSKGKIDLRKEPDFDHYVMIVGNREWVHNKFIDNFSNRCNEYSKLGYVPCYAPTFNNSYYSQQWVKRVKREVKPLDVNVVNVVLHDKYYPEEDGEF